MVLAGEQSGQEAAPHEQAGVAGPPRVGAGEPEEAGGPEEEEQDI